MLGLCKSRTEDVLSLWCFRLLDFDCVLNEELKRLWFGDFGILRPVKVISPPKKKKRLMGETVH